MLKRAVDVVEILVAVAALVFTVLLFTGGDDEGGQADAGDSGPPDGAALYDARCASCHGSDGGGGVGPALNDGAVVASFPDPADQATVIREGRQGMPSFADLSDSEIDAIVRYTRDAL